MLFRKKVRQLTNDPFMRRLHSTVIGEGMLTPGNSYLMDKAICEMPETGCLFEIGVYGGLSTNLMLHLLGKHGKNNQLYGCDAWVYEGYKDHLGNPETHMDGRPDVDRKAYMEHIRNSYISAARLLHPERLPYTTHLTSDEFFMRANRKEELTDVFGRPFVMEQAIAFAYIDGDHSLRQTIRDFENVARYLLPGGLILIDDSADYYSYGSAAFMRTFRKNYPEFEIVAANPNYLVRKKREPRS